MGIYVLNKRVFQLIPENQPFDMPELIQSLLKERACIVSFESKDLWFDIGTMEDQEKVKRVFGIN